MQMDRTCGLHAYIGWCTVSSFCFVSDLEVVGEVIDDFLYDDSFYVIQWNLIRIPIPFQCRLTQFTRHECLPRHGQSSSLLTDECDQLGDGGILLQGILIRIQGEDTNQRIGHESEEKIDMSE